MQRISRTRRGALALVLGGVAMLYAGCGGGGSSAHEATRKRVIDMHQRLTNSAQTFGSIGKVGGIEDSAGATRPPMVSAFLTNVASAPKPTRAARIAAMHRTRQETQPGDPGKPVDPPIWVGNSFYFDYYLGLWVQISDTATESRYDLFEDEAKTKPAGFIRTTHPEDWSTFPQSYESAYEFTAGLLAGAHGSSKNVTNADWSGSSQYENVYADGWQDKGASNWSGQGDSSWTSRTASPTGQWTEHAGTFRSDGSGGMRMKGSDGYESIYIYNRDGSGRATFSGPGADLPVTVLWDAYGNATIYYKDGTSERIDGWWGRWWGGPVPIAVGAGTGSGGGTVQPDGTVSSR